MDCVKRVKGKVFLNQPLLLDKNFYDKILDYQFSLQARVIKQSVLKQANTSYTGVVEQLKPSTVISVVDPDYDEVHEEKEEKLTHKVNFCSYGYGSCR